MSNQKRRKKAGEDKGKKNRARRVAARLDVDQSVSTRRKAGSSSSRGTRQASAGISNRETPAEEADERRAHPPLDPTSPPPEDAGGSVGEPAVRGGHTSHKAGSRSVAQKEAGSRYPDRSMPAARKVSGAYGQESETPAARDRKGSLHQSTTQPGSHQEGRNSRQSGQTNRRAPGDNQKHERAVRESGRNRATGGDAGRR
jgi:hypothetical protein